MSLLTPSGLSIVSTVMVAMLLAGCSTAAPNPTPVTPTPVLHGNTEEPDPAAVRRACEVVALIDRYGLYATGPTWETSRAQTLARLEQTRTGNDALNALYAPLRAGGGKHSRIMRETPPQETGGWAARPRPSVVETAGITTITIASNPPTAEIDDDVTTLTEGITAHDTTTCGWIIDLTRYQGGSFPPLFRGLAPLLPEGDVVTFRDRDGRRRGWWSITDRTLVVGGPPSPGLGDSGGHRWTVSPHVAERPIAVLQSSETASAGEGGVIAFKGLPHVRTFGQGTAGYTSGNVGIDGPAGSTVLLTVGTMVDRSGHDYADTPIPPDVTTSPSAAAHAAERWLATRGCPSRHVRTRLPAGSA